MKRAAVPVVSPFSPPRNEFVGGNHGEGTHWVVYFSATLWGCDHFGCLNHAMVQTSTKESKIKTPFLWLIFGRGGCPRQGHDQTGCFHFFK
jgi:hypothetical protein